jgi:hypothetical protein
VMGKCAQNMRWRWERSGIFRAYFDALGVEWAIRIAIHGIKIVLNSLHGCHCWVVSLVEVRGSLYCSASLVNGRGSTLLVS